jgi:hypothetical protein
MAIGLDLYEPHTPAASSGVESEFTKGYFAGKRSEKERVKAIMALPGDTSTKLLAALETDDDVDVVRQKLGAGATMDDSGASDGMFAAIDQINKQRGFKSTNSTSTEAKDDDPHGWDDAIARVNVERGFPARGR